MADFQENQEIKIDNLQLIRINLIIKRSTKELLSQKNEFLF